MSDQLSQHVRRHFLASADERPASAQLDTILRLTATQPQGASWLVRLRWLVSPAAPFANAGLRLALIAGAIVLALGAVVLIAGGGSNPPAPSSPFEGTWTSTDFADDSTQTLIVGVGPTPRVQFEDDYSMNCDAQGDSSTVYTADAIGQVAASQLTVNFPISGCVTWQVTDFKLIFDFQPAANTLLDSQGITWHRVP